LVFGVYSAVEFGVRCIQCSWIWCSVYTVQLNLPSSVTQRRGAWPSNDPAVAVLNADSVLPSKW